MESSWRVAFQSQKLAQGGLAPWKPRELAAMSSLGSIRTVPRSQMNAGLKVLVSTCQVFLGGPVF